MWAEVAPALFPLPSGLCVSVSAHPILFGTEFKQTELHAHVPCHFTVQLATDVQEATSRTPRYRLELSRTCPLKMGTKVTLSHSRVSDCHGNSRKRTGIEWGGLNFYRKLPKGLVLGAGLEIPPRLFPQGCGCETAVRLGRSRCTEVNGSETCSPAHCSHAKCRPALARTFNYSKESRHLVF